MDDVTPPAPEVDIRVLTAGATEEEIAAAVVLARAVIADRAAHRALSAARVPSAWLRSARGLRGTVHAGAGEWRGFTA